MKKFIFLDIDGVLATDKQFRTNTKKFHENHQWAKDLKVPYPWDKDAVKVFNEILAATGAEIIITSDWKKYWSLEELDIIFRENGVDKTPIDKTSINKMYFTKIDAKKRSSEIESYLANNGMLNQWRDEPIGQWVILDDLDLNIYLPDKINERFFKTPSSKGIKKSGLKEKIILKLNEVQ